jgi:hypothetical protein
VASRATKHAMYYLVVFCPRKHLLFQQWAASSSTWMPFAIDNLILNLTRLICKVRSCSTDQPYPLPYYQDFTQEDDVGFPDEKSNNLEWLRKGRRDCLYAYVARVRSVSLKSQWPIWLCLWAWEFNYFYKWQLNRSVKSQGTVPPDPCTWLPLFLGDRVATVTTAQRTFHQWTPSPLCVVANAVRNTENIDGTMVCRNNIAGQEQSAEAGASAIAGDPSVPDPSTLSE